LVKRIVSMLACHGSALTSSHTVIVPPRESPALGRIVKLAGKASVSLRTETPRDQS
jgi:hypothetical protein